MLYRDIEDLIGEVLPREIRDTEIKRIYDSTKEKVKGGLLVLVDSVKERLNITHEEIELTQPDFIICDEKTAISTARPHIKVKNSRELLARLYSAFYMIDYTKTDFIAITGTNGKTTTATLIYEILLYSGYKAGFIGTGKIEYMRERLTDNYYSMTTPDPKMLYSKIAVMQKRGAEVIVMEASSHAIALKKLSPIPFKLGLFTNLSLEHSDFHKSIEDYYNAKLSLFYQVEKGIFNSDDKYSTRAMSECFDICSTTSVGILYEAEARATNIEVNGFLGSAFLYKDKGRLFKTRINLIGHHNIYNSLFALKCAIEYGVKPYLANEALQKIKSIDGRFDVIEDKVFVIIDYAHTPEAFEKILNFTNSIKNTRQKIHTVFGCGGNRDKSKRPIMAKIASKYSYSVTITEDNSRSENVKDIINDIARGVEGFKNLTVIYSRQDAIEYAINQAEDNDIILILGKGHEKYNLGINGYTDFDEKQIAINALRSRALRRKNEN